MVKLKFQKDFSGDGHGDGCGGGNWSSGLINSLRIRKVRCLQVTKGEN